MTLLCQHLYPAVSTSTFFESCGVADLITTCYGGRNRKIAQQRVLTGKSFEELEVEMLNGQKLQGTLTAKEIYFILREKGMEKKFPLFTTVYRIVYENAHPRSILEDI